MDLPFFYQYIFKTSLESQIGGWFIGITTVIFLHADSKQIEKQKYFVSIMMINTILVAMTVSPNVSIVYRLLEITIQPSIQGINSFIIPVLCTGRHIRKKEFSREGRSSKWLKLDRQWRHHKSHNFYATRLMHPMIFFFAFMSAKRSYMRWWQRFNEFHSFWDC